MRVYVYVCVRGGSGGSWVFLHEFVLCGCHDRQCGLHCFDVVIVVVVVVIVVAV